MHLIDSISYYADIAWTGIKDAGSYVGQWLTYFVTLGHSEYPKFKESEAQQTQIVQHVIPLGARDVQEESRKASEGNKFLEELKRKISAIEGNKFQSSVEYQEYIDDKNPFSSVQEYYQKFSAKAFTDTLDKEARNHFINSQEYKDYLNQDPFSTDSNPFSPNYAEPIEKKYENYLKDYTDRLQEKVKEYNREVYTFFNLEEDKQENEIKQSFKESLQYKKLVDQLQKDINFSLTLDEIKEKYKNYKDNLDNENNNLLNGLPKKDEFMQSSEYTRISKKTTLVPKDIDLAYKDFTTRKKQEVDFNEYIKELQSDAEKYNVLKNSPEYLGVKLEPGNLNRLKGAVLLFENRYFRENIPERHKDFLKSEPYNEIVSNPFSSLTEIKEAYKKYVEEKQTKENQNIDEYLKKLEAKLKIETKDDGYYNQFVNSEFFINAWNNPEKTQDDIEFAFKQFRNENPRNFWEGWFGSW